MADQKSFSQYLAEAQAQIGKSSLPAARTFTSIGPAAKVPGDQDALSWFIDILSRPMRAVQNPVNQAMNEAQKIIDAEKTGQSYDVLGGIGNVLTSGPRGFFSTNPDDQPAGNQLIEKGTDVIGQVNDPNYKNVEDNVNPWVKGIGGFALDVGLDPLTYVPGAVFAKIGSGIAKGVKGAATGASAAVAGTRLGKAAQKALDRGNAAERIAAEVADQTNVDKLVTNAEDLLSKADNPGPAIDVAPVPTKPGTKPRGKKINPTQAAAEATATTAKITNDAIENATEAAKMATEGQRVPLFSENLAAKMPELGALRGFSAEIEASRAATPVWTETTVPKQAREWIQEKFSRARAGEDVSVFVPATKAGAIAETKWTAKDIIEIGLNFNKKEPDVQKRLLQMWQSAYKAANPNPGALEDLFADYKAANPVAKAKLAEVIGPKASEQLMKMNLPTFKKATEFLADALAGKIELANPAKMTSSPEKFVRDIMEHNGVEIPSLKSVQNRAEPIVGSELAVANEAAIDAGKNLLDAPDLSKIPEENIRLLAKTLTTFLDEFLDLSAFQFEKAPGVLGTVEEIWAGIGRRPFDLNGKDQMSLFMQSIRDLTDELKSLPRTVAGSQRASVIQFKILARMRDVSKWFDDKGGAFFIGVGEDQVRMDYAQMLTILSDKANGLLNTNVIRMAIGNFDTLVPISNIEDAVLLVVKNGDAADEEIIRALEAVPRVSENATPPPNALTGNGKDKLQYNHYLRLPKNPDKSGLIKYVKTGKVDKQSGAAYYDGIVNVPEYRRQLVAVIKASAADLQAQVVKNMDAAQQRLIAESRALTLQEFENLLSFMNDPIKLADSIRAMKSIQTSTMNIGRKARVAPEAQKTAAILVERAADPVTVESAKQAVKTESVLRKSDDAKLPTKKRQAKTRKEAVANSQKNFDTDAQNAKAGVEANKLPEDGYAADGSINNLQANNEANGHAAINMHIGRTLNPWNRFFNISANAARTAQRFLASKAEWTRGRAEYQMQLRNIVKEHPGVLPGTDTTIITQAFRNIANGTTMPETAAAEQALLPVIQTVFGLTNDSRVLESLFLRSGGTEIDMLAYLKKANVEFDFDLDLATRMVDEGLSPSLTEAILSQWGNLFKNADRPIELLNDIHYAGSLMVMDKAVANSFMRVEGLTSDVPKKGYGLVPLGLNPLEHPFLAHLPENTYIDVQYLTEIKRIEEVAMENRTFSGPFGTWLNGSYTPLLNAWKRGVTIYRLGHHVRNFLSSESLQYVAEGTKYYGKSANAAARILAAHRSYKDVDWVETVQGIGSAFSKEGTDIAKMPTSGEVLFDSPKWGKMTIGRMYEAAEKSGLFTEFKQSEDLLDEMVEPGAIQKFSSKIALEGTKVEKFAAGVSEYQAHYNRLHHFTQILMKESKSGKTFEDAVEAAAWRVKRHHPDSSMLASGEAKLRAAIPFYTWFRLTMPVIAEGVATNPGRFLTFPKAWYNGAVAMGVDPYSMSDPFPQDQLFPSFLRDQMNGPMFEVNGNYFGANPGIAYFDVLNQFVPDPVRGTLGMLSPAIKIPGELIGGTQWQTGARIKDFSDYIDSSLPGINYLSNLTGYSATGSLWGTLSGTGLDEQLGVAKGDKTDLDKGLSIANWLTGFGIQNMSKQSYIDYAEIEKRNKAARDAAEEEGTARSPF